MMVGWPFSVSAGFDADGLIMSTLFCRVDVHEVRRGSALLREQNILLLTGS